MNTAKQIQHEAVCRLEELAIAMLPKQSEGNKSVKRIREMAKICREPIIIDKLYDKESDAFRVGEEFGEKCEKVNCLAEAILDDRQQNFSSLINRMTQKNLTS